MNLRYQIYLALIIGTIIYGIYEKDSTRVILGLLVLPMCFMGKRG